MNEIVKIKNSELATKTKQLKIQDYELEVIQNRLNESVKTINAEPKGVDKIKLKKGNGFDKSAKELTQKLKIKE